jgi:hypothetical protein
LEINVHSFWKPAGRALARHLTNLRLSLEDLTRRLKASVAATIGRVADEAAQEVVHVLMGNSASRPAPSRNEPMFWGDRRENSNQYGYLCKGQPQLTQKGAHFSQETLLPAHSPDQVFLALAA